MAVNLHNTSTSDIRSELDQIISDTSEWMQRASELLIELRNRGEKHPLMSSNTLRHFKLIGGGKLDPAAALAVGGNRNLVRALARMPRGEQYGYATDKTIQVVERLPDGSDVTEFRQITHLSQSALDRVFGEKGLRSLSEQRKLLGSPPNRKRVGEMIVDLDQKVIIIGRRKISAKNLKEPLKALGYALKRDDRNEPIT